MRTQHPFLPYPHQCCVDVEDDGMRLRDLSDQEQMLMKQFLEFQSCYEKSKQCLPIMRNNIKILIIVIPYIYIIYRLVFEIV